MKKLLFFIALLLIVFSLNQSQVRAQEDDSGTQNTATAPTPYSKSACEKSCGACAPPPPATPINRDCEGNLTYDTCVDLDRNFQSDTANFCKTSKYYHCYAKDNPNCSSSYTLDCSTCPNGKNRDKNTPLSSATCYTDCMACQTKDTLGQTTYDTCTDNKGGNTGNGTLCSNGATKFGCQASLNNNCQSGNMEYDCPSSATTPPSSGTGNPFQVVISPVCSGNAGNMSINVGWSNPVHSSDGNYYYPKSMGLTLYQAGGAVGNTCIDTNKQSNYTFSGNYSSSAKFEVAAIAYNSPDCAGATLASSDKQAVSNAYCAPGQGGRPQNYSLDRLTFANQTLDITGSQTTTYHLDGKAGEAKSFPVRIAALFSRGGDRLNKPYVINFVYKPKQGSTSLIYNISPVPGLVTVGSDKQVTFKWSPVAGVKKYRLIVAPHPPLHGPSEIDNNCPAPYEGFLVCKELTDTSYKVSSNILIDGIDNYWYVTAFDDKGNVLEGQKWKITFSGALPEPKEPPCESITCATNLQGPANNIVYGLGPVSFSWTNTNSNTYKYALFVLDPVKSGYPGVAKIIQSNTLTLPAPDINTGNYILLPGTTYSWSIYLAKSYGDFFTMDNNGFLKRSRRVQGADFKTSNPTSATITALEPFNNSLVSTLTPTLKWSNVNKAIFYYEVQLSKDKTFNTDPKTATAAVQHMYIHGGETTPLNSYHVPDAYQLEINSTYYWRVRPRVGDEGTGVEWSQIWTFTTPGQ